MNRVLRLVVLLSAVATSALGQNDQTLSSPKEQSQPRPSKDQVVRIGVTLVQLDAVVTDKAGKQVTDLTREDFRLLVDGKPQRITNFSYISNVAARPAAGRDSGHADKLAPLVPSPGLQPEQVKRTIALVIDDLNMSFESMAYTREALKKFVTEQIQPGDLSAIIVTGGAPGSLQQFTSDKRLLLSAVEHLRWNLYGNGLLTPDALTPIRSSSAATSLPPGPGLRTGNAIGRLADREFDYYRQQVFSIGTLGVAEQVIRSLRELPGRKSLVLFSEGFFTLFGSRERTPDNPLLDPLNRLTDLANRSSVMIYTVHPPGLQTLGLTAADNIRPEVGFNSPNGDRVHQQMIEALTERHQRFFQSQQSLAYLANTTGGFPVENTNNLSAGMRQILEDQQGYYLIGYVPDDATFNTVRGLHAFHKISVTVDRPGLRVRSRTGFLGVPDEDTKPAAPQTRPEQLLAALTSPFAATGVNLRLTSIFANSQRGSYLYSMVYIDASQLTFNDEPGDWHKAVVDVLAVTFGSNGRVVDQINRQDNIRLRGNAYGQALKHGLVYNITLPVKTAGPYQLRVAVRDAASERVGSANQFVEVPDVGKARLALSGMVVSGKETEPGSAKVGLKNASAIGGGAGAGRSGEERKDTAGEDAADTGPAVRSFRRGTDLDIGFVYAIYNARLDSKTYHPRLESQIRLFKDGKQVYAGPSTPLVASSVDDAKRIEIAGQLHLTKELEVGQYVLQIIVTDRLAKTKYNTATQWTDFEVTQ
jgi:VWFA-related protein